MSRKSKRPDSKTDKGNSSLKGKFIFANGDKYDGEYIQLTTGSGTKSGNKSNCNPQQIERQGSGMQELASGVVYNGTWTSDKMNGEGIMKHPNGSSYKGTFVNNEYHGQGVYTWSNGAKFEGIFEHNRTTGQGEYTDPKGRVWTGLFSAKAANNLHLKIL